MSESKVKAMVQQKYAQAALQVLEGGQASCCGGEASALLTSCRPITSGLYDEEQRSELPNEALAASLGCGNPTAMGELKPGDVVLDLGSGGGIDVLLAAKWVAPTGKAYGLEMTDEMIALSKESQRKSGLMNVEFLKGEIEDVPLPDNSVDVILSNCVINLSADKDRVLKEAFRVLKPGGRLAVSDIVTRGDIPDDIRRNEELWAGCLAGALDENDYLSRLREAGFVEPTIEPTRIYRVEDGRDLLARRGIGVEQIASLVNGKFYSGFVRARKP